MTKELNFFQSEMETVSPDLLEDGPQENSPPWVQIDQQLQGHLKGSWKRSCLRAPIRFHW